MTYSSHTRPNWLDSSTHTSSIPFIVLYMYSSCGILPWFLLDFLFPHLLSRESTRHGILFLFSFFLLSTRCTLLILICMYLLCLYVHMYRMVAGVVHNSLTKLSGLYSCVYLVGQSVSRSFFFYLFVNIDRGLSVLHVTYIHALFHVYNNLTFLDYLLRLSLVRDGGGSWECAIWVRTVPFYFRFWWKEVVMVMGYLIWFEIRVRTVKDGVRVGQQPFCICDAINY